jgi:hypothetical protein
MGSSRLAHGALTPVSSRQVLKINRQGLQKRWSQSQQHAPSSPAALPASNFNEVKAEPSWLAAGNAFSQYKRSFGGRLRAKREEAQERKLRPPRHPNQ